MYAHKITGRTGPGDVVWGPAEEPDPEAGVLVDVVAAGVSFADLLQTRGQYQMKVPVPYVPGMDAAGVVRAAAPGLGIFRGSAGGGSGSGAAGGGRRRWPRRDVPVPDGMSFEQARR